MHAFVERIYDFYGLSWKCYMYTVIMPPFEEGGVYCFAHVRLSVGMSVGRYVGGYVGSP